MCHLQVVLTNLRVDMPRHSWSHEMYTFSCAQGRFLLPVAADHVTSMTPDMTRWAAASRVSVTSVWDAKIWLQPQD